MGKALDEVNKIIKNRITPFLIVNPIVIIWMTFLLIRVVNRDGMAVMMSGLFISVILVSVLLLIADRIVVRRNRLITIYLIEILLILTVIGLVDWSV